MRLFLLVLMSFSMLFSGVAQASKIVGPIKRGATLWKIAAHNKPARSISMTQMIQAIQKMNPEVFTPDHRYLSVGQTLVVPTSVKEVNHVLGIKPVVPVMKKQLEVEQPLSTKPALAQVKQSQVAPAPALSSSEVSVPLSVGTNSAQNFSSPVANNSPSNSGLPWGWIWFVVLLIVGGYFLWKRFAGQAFSDEAKGIAAVRLGISRYRRDPIITRHKTKRFKDAQDDATELSQIPFSAKSADAIANALIEMAEEDYDAAEKRLKKAIKSDKKNHDLRRKLLELYVKTNNQEAFKKESDSLEKVISKNSVLWTEVQALYLSTWAYD